MCEFEIVENPPLFSLETDGNGRAVVMVFCEIRMQKIPYKPYGRKKVTGTIEQIQIVVDKLNSEKISIN